MAFTFQKIVPHGTSNPIVARLTLQIFKILENCEISEETREKIIELYLNSLQKKLLRCWEIKERFRQEFNRVVETFKPQSGQAVEVPQIDRLDEECHNYLYEAKNYIRDLLQVVNVLYGTDFEEASEFSRAKKGGQSLIDFAEQKFGPQDAKTEFIKEARGVEEIIAFRNAVEHPGGYSGRLIIKNFSLNPGGTLTEPGWHREKDEKPVTALSPIRVDMDTIVSNLLTLGEDIIVSWAADNLKSKEMMRVAVVPEEQRDPTCAIKYVVTASHKLEEQLKALTGMK